MFLGQDVSIAEGDESHKFNHTCGNTFQFFSKFKRALFISSCLEMGTGKLSQHLSPPQKVPLGKMNTGAKPKDPLTIYYLLLRLHSLFSGFSPYEKPL